MAKNSGTVVVLAMAMAVVAMSAWGVQETEAACELAIALESCMSAVEADVQPSTECCEALTSYISTNSMDCVCDAAVASLYFLTHTADYAVLIPEKCSLTYAKGTQCAGMDIPGGTE